MNWENIDTGQSFVADQATTCDFRKFWISAIAPPPNLSLVTVLSKFAPMLTSPHRPTRKKAASKSNKAAFRHETRVPNSAESAYSPLGGP
jgi:hypothetical protein